VNSDGLRGKAAVESGRSELWNYRRLSAATRFRTSFNSSNSEHWIENDLFRVADVTILTFRTDWTRRLESGQMPSLLLFTWTTYPTGYLEISLT
jgi:hypothetical protein